MLLSHVLIATTVVMFLPYLRPTFAFNRYGQLRSISGLICQLKPFGHFFMSLANLLIFLILSMEFELVAWLYWVAFQLILSFDVDEYPLGHFLSLMTYIGLLLYFWYEACSRHGLWTEAIPLFVSSGLFALLVLFNLVRFGPKSPWPYQTVQSLIEIAWVCCCVYLIYKYEELLQGKGVTVVAIV